MRIVRFALAVVLVACGGGAAAIAPTTQPSANPVDAFPEPAVVASVNGVAHVALAAAINPATNAPGFSYDGQFVAPTIEVQPGDTIEIDYTNDLPASSSAPLNVTNLHFHGMTVSPNAPSDEVLMTLAMPGQTLHYSVPIPADEQPGLYWYHPHPHGESNWQVESGMAGAIIVDGIESYVPSVAQMRTRLLLLEDPQDEPRYKTLLETRAVAADSSLRHVAAYDACRPEVGRHVTVNGLTNAQIGIRPGEQQFFRVVNASADRYFDLSVDGEQLQLVALDGYAIGSYPGNPQTQSVSDVLVPPAGRAEFIVTGQSSATTLRSKCFDSGPDGDPDPEVALAALVNDAGASSASRLRRMTKPLQTNPFTSGPPPAPVAQRTITLTENVVTNAFFINGQAFDVNAAPQIVSHVGTTERWTVVNNTGEVHAFHVHQVHFIVQAINGVPQTTLHWVDTVNVPYETPGGGTQQPGTVTLLVDLRDPVIVGTFVYHCHILEHEDGGMMAKIQVL